MSEDQELLEEQDEDWPPVPPEPDEPEMTEVNEAARLPLEEAAATANRFVQLVMDCSERIVVAGSIRRKRPFPKDIDIVAISKVVDASKPGWFAPVKTRESLLHSRIDEFVKKGVAKPRVKVDGKTMVSEFVAFVEFEGLPLDLYYASEETWWGLVQMRTGSARFNTMLATRALGMGLKFHGDGHGITRNGVRLDDSLSEESIFKALNLKYLLPEERE